MLRKSVPAGSQAPWIEPTTVNFCSSIGRTDAQRVWSAVVPCTKTRSRSGPTPLVGNKCSVFRPYPVHASPPLRILSFIQLSPSLKYLCIQIYAFVGGTAQIDETDLVYRISAASTEHIETFTYSRSSPWRSSTRTIRMLIRASIVSPAG